LDGTVDIFYRAAERAVAMHWVDPGTANSEDSIRWCTLPSSRTKFKGFGADEFLRSTPVSNRASPKAKLIELPRVGGLHHRYEWSEAA
jgi:hypothetical protein